MTAETIALTRQESTEEGQGAPAEAEEPPLEPGSDEEPPPSGLHMGLRGGALGTIAASAKGRHSPRPGRGADILVVPRAA